MALIQKANVVLEILDSEVPRHLELGYNLIDEKGNVVEEGRPQDFESYKRAYFAQKEEIQKLQTQIEELQKQIKAKPVEGKRTKNSESK